MRRLSPLLEESGQTWEHFVTNELVEGAELVDGKSPKSSQLFGIQVMGGGDFLKQYVENRVYLQCCFRVGRDGDPIGTRLNMFVIFEDLNQYFWTPRG
jgi:hypothetical protein